jgi:agmatinase
MKCSLDPGAFGGLSADFCHYERAAIAVLPVPYDGTSTWMKGADRGPRALLDASANMELYDIETDSEVFRRGIVTLDPISCPDNPEEMAAVVYERARSVLQDRKFIVGIGGEHTISIGLVRAAAETFQNLSVLQFDAHADTRDEYQRSRYNHACVMSIIGEICPYVQAGIRSMAATEAKKIDANRVLLASHMYKDPNAISKVLSPLTKNVYMTIDLDVLDPSVMPSTGTPEPGGLDWYTLMGFIESVVKEKSIVGLDVTELLPNPANRAPDFLAAKLVYRVLSMIFVERREDGGKRESITQAC